MPSTHAREHHRDGPRAGATTAMARAAAAVVRHAAVRAVPYLAASAMAGVALADAAAGGSAAPVGPPAAALPDSLPVDADRDGLLDAEDACPRSPRGAVVDGEGCLALASDADSIPFAPGSAWLAPEATRRLERALRTLERYPNTRLEVRARTSLSGDAAVGLPLRRTGAVVEWFAASGVPATRIDLVAVAEPGSVPRPTVELRLLR